MLENIHLPFNKDDKINSKLSNIGSVMRYTLKELDIAIINFYRLLMDRYTSICEDYCKSVASVQKTSNSNPNADADDSYNANINEPSGKNGYIYDYHGCDKEIYDENFCSKDNIIIAGETFQLQKLVFRNESFQYIIL